MVFKPISEWTRQGKIFVTAITTLAAIAGAFAVLEPYSPATHGWVRGYIEAFAAPLILERNKLIAQAQTETNTKLTEQGSKIDILSEQFLELAISIYDARKHTLDNELIEWNQRLSLKPDDTFLLSKKQETEDLIKTTTVLRQDAMCELNKMRNMTVREC